MSCIAVDMSTPPSHGWFSLSLSPPETFVLVPTLLPRPSPPSSFLFLPHGECVNDPTHDGGDGVSVSVRPKRKIAGCEG